MAAWPLVLGVHAALAADGEAAPTTASPAEPAGVDGYRLARAGRGRSAGGRTAVVADFDGPFIVELAPWVRGSVKRFSWNFSLGLVAGGDAYDSSLAMGNLRAGAWLHLGKEALHAIGVTTTAPTTFGVGSGLEFRSGQAHYWGTIPSETIPTTGIALAYRGSRGVFGWEAHTGLRTSGYDSNVFSVGLDLGLLVAAAPELAPGWFFVGELEAVTEPSPVHLRALGRKTFGARGMAVELGLAVPVARFVVDPTLQVLGQVRAAW